MRSGTFRGVVFGCLVALAVPSAFAAADPQPLRAQVRRVAQALEMLGAPLSAEQRARLDKASDAAEIGAVLDPLCLAHVHINPESRVKVARGDAKAQLAQHGWRVFL